MIRLFAATTGADEFAEYERIAPRLRGATLVDYAVGFHESDSFDAAAVHHAATTLDELSSYAADRVPVLLVDPQALSAEQLDQLTQQFEATGTALRIGWLSRFQPSMQSLKQSLDDGQLGAPGLVRIHRWQPPASTTVSAIDSATSEIDLARWLIGSPVEVVYATGPSEGTDYVQIHLGFADGAMALIDVSHSLPPGGEYSSVSVIGSSGSAYADDHHNQQLVFGGESPAARRTGEGSLDRLAMLQEFIDAIRAGEPDVSIDSLRNCSAILDAVRESLASHEAVNL